MPQNPNTILKSLKYLGAEARASGDFMLGEIIDTAVEMGTMFERLQHLEDNVSNRQDMMRIMTFIHFYRTATPVVQKQVYSILVSKQENISAA